MASTMLLNAQPVEGLPPYSRRDPDALSIRSSAPSYVSEAPTYHSTLPRFAPLISRSTTTSSPGLPPPTYAPGFHRAPAHRPGARGDLTGLRFDISEWSATRSGPQARHYEAVAHRRATVASEDEELSRAVAMTGFNLQSLLAPVAEAPPPSVDDSLSWSAAPEAAGGATTRPTESPTGAAATSTPNSAPSEPQQPISPLEDPDLVGHVAASAARERRLYLQQAREERVRRDAQALRQEDRSWDVLLAQMADWKERERSQEKCRRDARARKGLRRFFR